MTDYFIALFWFTIACIIGVICAALTSFLSGLMIPLVAKFTVLFLMFTTVYCVFAFMEARS